MDAFLQGEIKKATSGCWVEFDFTLKFSSIRALAAGASPGCAVSFSSHFCIFPAVFYYLNTDKGIFKTFQIDSE